MGALVNTGSHPLVGPDLEAPRVGVGSLVLVPPGPFLSPGLDFLLCLMEATSLPPLRTFSSRQLCVGKLWKLWAQGGTERAERLVSFKEQLREAPCLQTGPGPEPVKL